jgi:hypothetical protein
LEVLVEKLFGQDQFDETTLKNPKAGQSNDRRNRLAQ